jgi:hypothetical protein
VKLTHPRPGYGVLTMALPGPDRKRTLSLYCYRVTYRSPDPGEPGCVMTGEVTGGRQAYQVALERTGGDGLLWHCSCADAVYRGEDDPKHVCKHVRGLVDTLPVAPPVRRVAARAA